MAARSLFCLATWSAISVSRSGVIGSLAVSDESIQRAMAITGAHFSAARPVKGVSFRNQFVLGKDTLKLGQREPERVVDQPRDALGLAFGKERGNSVVGGGDVENMVRSFTASEAWSLTLKVRPKRFCSRRLWSGPANSRVEPRL